MVWWLKVIVCLAILYCTFAWILAVVYRIEHYLVELEVDWPYLDKLLGLIELATGKQWANTHLVWLVWLTRRWWLAYPIAVLMPVVLPVGVVWTFRRGETWRRKTRSARSA